MESPGHDASVNYYIRAHTEYIRMFWKNVQCNICLYKGTDFSVNKEN